MTNYRIERIDNGYILHVTSGKDGPISKFCFLSKAALLRHLDDVL